MEDRISWRSEGFPRTSLALGSFSWKDSNRYTLRLTILSLMISMVDSKSNSLSPVILKYNSFSSMVPELSVSLSCSNSFQSALISISAKSRC